MDADLRKIKRYTKMMKKEGVLVIKTPELEIQLSPLAVFHEELKITDEVTQTSKEPPTPFTEQDILFWSTPGHIPEATA